MKCPSFVVFLWGADREKARRMVLNGPFVKLSACDKGLLHVIKIPHRLD